MYFLSLKKDSFYAPNFRVLLPHRRRITESSETTPLALNAFYSWWSEPRINNVKSAKLLCAFFFFFSIKLATLWSSCSRFCRGCLSSITDWQHQQHQQPREKYQESMKLHIITADTNWIQQKGQLTILFSPWAPLLNVVARVEEQLSEYQGDSPWSDAELIDRV